MPLRVAGPGEFGIVLPVFTQIQMVPGVVEKVLMVPESSYTVVAPCTCVRRYETVAEPV